MFARSLLCLALVGCAANSEVADWRGTGRGWTMFITPKPDPALTDAGRRVQVVASSACRWIGYVTGAATKRGFRLADQDRAQFAASLSRDGAITDARNFAGGAGADAIVLDADETWESGRDVRYLVHGRAFRCR